MCPSAIPVSEHRLGLQGGEDVEVLGDAEEQPARRPQLVTDERRREDPDLELPLAHHHLGVGALDPEAGLHAGGCVALDDLSPGHLVAADAAIIRALRCGKARLGPAQRAPVLEEGVVLFDPEPGLLVGILLRQLGALPPGVRAVRRHIGVQDFTHHELVALRPQGVGAHEDGLEDAVGVAPFGLVRAGAVEAPDSRSLPPSTILVLLRRSGVGFVPSIQMYSAW